MARTMNRHDASLMVTGYVGNRHMGFNNFQDAMEWLSSIGHDTFHFCQGPADGPKTRTNEHRGKPECYVAIDGRGTAIIFENYRYGCLQYSESVL